MIMRFWLLEQLKVSQKLRNTLVTKHAERYKKRTYPAWLPYQLFQGTPSVYFIT